MKQTHSRSFVVPARIPLAAACALILGAAAVAQPTGAASSPSGTPTNTDRYDQSTRNRESAERQTGASTSGAAAGSLGTDDARTRTDRGSTTAETATTESTTMTRRLPWGDRRFVTKAADCGMSEVQLAQLAVERASNPEVRGFAQKIIDSHEKVNSELTNIAGQKNVKLDDEDGKDRTYRRLSNKSGADFDEYFVENMIEMHEDHVKLFEKAAKDAKDTDLRSFASKHVDHLRDHLQQAQSLRQAIVPTGRAEDTSERTPDTTPTIDPTRSSTTPTDTSTTGSARPESRR